MRGRFTLRTKLDVLLAQFAAELGETRTFDPRYNIAPTEEVLAIQRPRQLVTLRWGLVPSWAKDAKLAPINARGDTVADKPTFRSAFKKRRCLVLADGYYEWLRKGKAKLPHLYELDDGRPFAMAGLWEGETCSVITTDANELAAKVHDRMPVILPAIHSSLAHRSHSAHSPMRLLPSVLAMNLLILYFDGARCPRQLDRIPCPIARRRQPPSRQTRLNAPPGGQAIAPA